MPRYRSEHFKVQGFPGWFLSWWFNAPKKLESGKFSGHPYAISSFCFRRNLHSHQLLFIIAFIISAPIAYYIMHEWLKKYAYRIPLSASIFIMAILGSILIAWITMAYRAINAALANPVTSLRSE